MNTSRYKYILLASDYFPNIGGVVQFTFDIAKALDSTGRLDYLLTPQPQTRRSTFKVVAPLRLLTGKLGSLLTVVQQITQLSLLMANRMKPKPAVVMVNSLFVNYSYLVIKFCKLLGLEYEVVIHGLDVIEQNRSNKGRLLKVLSDANMLIFNSKATRELTVSMFPKLENKRFKIIYPAFDKAHFDQFFRDKALIGDREIQHDFPDLPVGKRIIFTICRLVPRKGVDYAIRGLSSFLKANRNWIYVIAGEGPHTKELKKCVDNEGLSDGVFFVGNVSDQQKFGLFNLSEVFIMPNHLMEETDFEGFGISFLEAQYFKNWVIAGKSGGVVEAVDQASGFFVDFSGDPVAQIEDYINQIAQKENLCNEQGRQYVTSHFEIRKMQERFS